MPDPNFWEAVKNALAGNQAPVPSQLSNQPVLGNAGDVSGVGVNGLMPSIITLAHALKSKPQTFQGQPVLNGAVPWAGKTKVPSNELEDLINQKNTLYHSTRLDNLKGILGEGKITPGEGSSGVSMSRVPTITYKGGNPEEGGPEALLKLDANQVGSTTPTVSQGWNKTTPTLNNEWPSYLTPEETQRYEAIENYRQQKMKSPGGLNVAEGDALSKEKETLYQQAQQRRKAVGNVMNPNFEFEQQTNGQPVDINKALKEIILNKTLGDKLLPIKQDLESRGIPYSIKDLDQMNLDRLDREKLKALYQK